MDNGMESMLDTYLYETNSLLDQLDEMLVADEKSGEFSSDDVNEIFRIMHTIKGSSAMMEFGSLSIIAHHIEDLFFYIRDKGIESLNQEHKKELFNLMFRSEDFLRSEVEKVEQGAPLSDNLDSFALEINGFLKKISSPEGSAPDPCGSKNGADKADNRSLPSDPEAVCCLHIFLEEGVGMENLRAYMIANSLKECELDFNYYPADMESNPDSCQTIVENGFFLTFSNRETASQAEDIIKSQNHIRSYELLDMSVSPDTEPKQDAPDQGQDNKKAASTSAPAQTPGSFAQGSTPQPNYAPVKQNLISVNLMKLDSLMDIVGEIVITESMVTSSPELKGLRLDEFTKSARQLRKLTDELQDVSMSLRMVPVSATFQKMHRIVRDMCKKLNKQARLTLVGEETEIDKTIVDSIGDPIMHIVRNSMDHGIEEDVQDRIRAGKDPVGEITLSARQTGSEVIIEIRDDGQGVNDEAVLRKAVKNGLASPDVEYSHREILNFLMSPGFSTNTEVTEFSGRGVGMDVVKQNVEAVGGTVSLTSELGKGMTTTLKIPLTTAIMDGMEVSVGGSIFTIPIHNIRQSFKIHSDQLVHDAAGGEIFKCMGSFYPVVRMRELYQIEEGCTQVEDGILIWLEAGELSYCLFVDELLGEQQVVVKPLPSYLNSFNIKRSGIAGCTILGDGNISIILDVANLYSPFR